MSEDAEGSARRLADLHGLRFVDLTQSALVPGAASLLPEDVARRHHAVPIGRRLGTPVIAVSDPGDLFAMDALRSSVGREYVAVVARPDQVERAIRVLYTPAEIEALGADAGDGWPSGTPESLPVADGGAATITGSLPAQDLPGARYQRERSRTGCRRQRCGAHRGDVGVDGHAGGVAARRAGATAGRRAVRAPGAPGGHPSARGDRRRLRPRRAGRDRGSER